MHHERHNNMTDHPDRQVDAALRTLREHMQAVETPHDVEAALLAAFAKHQRANKTPRWQQYLALSKWGRSGGLAVIGGAVLAVLLIVSVPQTPVPAQPNASADDSAGFIALDSAEHIAMEPAPRLIETAIARTALAGLGVPLSPDNAGDMVRAQFLVSADGRPLAWRLLRNPSTFQPERG